MKQTIKEGSKVIISQIMRDGFIFKLEIILRIIFILSI